MNVPNHPHHENHEESRSLINITRDGKIRPKVRAIVSSPPEYSVQYRIQAVLPVSGGTAGGGALSMHRSGIQRKGWIWSSQEPAWCMTGLRIKAAYRRKASCRGCGLATLPWPPHQRGEGGERFYLRAKEGVQELRSR